MANSTINRILRPYGKGGRPVVLPVDGGTHLFASIMVSQLTATGMLVPTSTAGSGPCIGMSTHEQDATSLNDADARAAIITEAIFLLANASGGDALTEANLFGSVVYALDDHTVQNNSATGTLQPAGHFAGLEPDGLVRVYIRPTLVSSPSADVGALTFAAVAGTANQTLEAMPNPADSPATADALRDDVVANLLPPLRNNFADVATQLNAIRTALRAAGLMS